MTIAVILCAARKHNDAGHFRKRNGQPVRFVAQPDLAPPSKIYTQGIRRTNHIFA